ncbi:hypothetical protein BU17DRAFT_68097 [Hysterangium stoloniferum]|nr:hypothetical protein BU17DRAFT_68097 [Hysterangium stoloniferum]
MVEECLIRSHLHLHIQSAVSKPAEYTRIEMRCSILGLRKSSAGWHDQGAEPSAEVVARWRGLETVTRWRWRRIRQDGMRAKGRTTEDVDRRNRKKWAATKLHGLRSGSRLGVWLVLRCGAGTSTVELAILGLDCDCGDSCDCCGRAACFAPAPNVDIDAPDLKTGSDPVSDIPLDLGPLAPAAAAHIKSPPPNVPSLLHPKHKPSHDFRRGPVRDGMSEGDGELQLKPDSDLMFGSDSEPAATRLLRLRSCGGSIIKVPGLPDRYTTIGTLKIPARHPEFHG